MKDVIEGNKFKPYWVMSVNNYLCDASYSGKELKARNLFPSFRKFYFIKDKDGLNGFTAREEISNEKLVEKYLNNQTQSHDK